MTFAPGSVRHLVPIAGALLLAIAGCGVAQAATPTRAVACAADPVSRSICMIRLILDDVAREGIGGGGVSDITALSSSSYRASLPREEAITLYTYRFGFTAGTVTLLTRTEATQSKG